jgi:hypothetical protein
VFKVFQNYPNPFNAGTKINFIIPNSGYVNVKVYNSIGEEVVQLLEGMKTPGNYEILFDAKDLPSGLYLLKLELRETEKNLMQNQIRKMILLR